MSTIEVGDTEEGGSEESTKETGIEFAEKRG